MKKRTKVLLLLLSAMLLVAASVMGTLAYLTSQADVKNTFTVGKVGITMTESKVDENGKAIADTSTDSNAYKLIPGHEYDKDPTITVDSNSESCWLFVEVKNGIKALEDSNNTIHNQITTTNGWKQLENVTTSDVYYKFWNKEAADVSYTVPVFSSFKIATNAQSDETNWTNNLEVKVTAYAIQADGINEASTAWSYLMDQLNPGN